MTIRNGIKLFVDDMRVCPAGWRLARTNTEAIRLLSLGVVQVCSIDHDICVPNVEFLSSSVRKRLAIGEETFQPVAYYIASMPKATRPSKVVLHTANASAAVRMSGILYDAGIKAEIAESDALFDVSMDEL